MKKDKKVKKEYDPERKANSFIKNKYLLIALAIVYAVLIISFSWSMI
jgi:hypothetical protein